MAAGHAESVACLVREAGTSCGACERFQPRLIPGERSGFIQGIPDRQMQGLAYMHPSPVNFFRTTLRSSQQ